MSYNPNSNYSWTDYRVGLKHDVHNRVSAVCQSHSLIINSSIITSILLHKGCQLCPLIIEYVSWYCFTTMLFRDCVGWSDETTTFRPPKLVLLAIEYTTANVFLSGFSCLRKSKRKLNVSSLRALWTFK